MRKNAAHSDKKSKYLIRRMKMNKNRLKMLSLIIALLFASITVFENDAFARMGGGRSFGSRGSRSYSPPRQYSNPGPSRQQAAPSQGQAAPAAPAGGGFMRGIGGGLLGGLLGGMLFSSLGFGGMGGGFGGSGIGMIEILLLLGLGYFIFKMVKRRRGGENLAYQTSSQPAGYQTETFPSYGSGSRTQEDDVSVGIRHIREMDPNFDEGLFKDTAMDIFFKVQGAWMNRDLSTVKNLLTDEMKGVVQRDIDALLRDKKVNRLENIAVRKVEIIETWQETGQDFLTVLLTANLLDYTTDDSTGEVVEGSKTDPVRFEEFWTFTRPVGNNPWKLSAINQPK
jgi:predicted lipid-binding transport protein (Tim44 family)